LEHKEVACMTITDRFFYFLCRLQKQVSETLKEKKELERMLEEEKDKVSRARLLVDVPLAKCFVPRKEISNLFFLIYPITKSILQYRTPGPLTHTLQVLNSPH
jgi:hypothetical protein